MKRKIYRWEVNGVKVELIPQFAVAFVKKKDLYVDGCNVERALFYSKEEAMAAIHERLGEIVGEQQGMDAGIAALFLEAEIE